MLMAQLDLGVDRRNTRQESVWGIPRYFRSRKTFFQRRIFTTLLASGMIKNKCKSLQILLVFIKYRYLKYNKVFTILWNVFIFAPANNL